mmetsp:Transcript_27910/g.63186  ORF Transcript_27910/g.63186 Transcript_27910/m.63186 type:complete len:372 (+) Transcript_27910:78-1193(+)
MIARLALLLLALAVVASAENLRTEAYDVPIDNARGARVLKRMQTKSAAKHAKAKKAMDVEALTKKASKKGLEAKAEPLIDASEKAKVGRSLQGYNDDYTEFDSPWTRVTMAGSLVTRSRPNSDCSGPVTEIAVQPAGSCYYNGEDRNGEDYSLATGTYESASGELLIAHFQFKAHDCAGEPDPEAGDLVLRGPYKPCQMLVDEYGSAGPLMGGAVLSDKTVMQSMEQEKAGFMVKHYSDFGCFGDVLAYTLYRDDACHLDIEYNMPVEIIEEGRRLAPIVVEPVLNADSTFSYVKVNKCQGNTVYITGYTDSACTHKSYKAEVDLVEEDAYESFITCRRNVAEHHYYDDEDTDDYMGRQVSGSFSEGTCSG